MPKSSTLAKVGLTIVVLCAIGFGIHVALQHTTAANFGNESEVESNALQSGQDSQNGLNDKVEDIDGSHRDSNDNSEEKAVHQDIFGPDTLVFPNGEVVSVRWTRLPVPRNKPEPPYIDSYDQLVANAEAGDPESAFALWSLLDQCREYAYETKEELNRVLGHLQETHYYQTPEMPEPQWAGSVEGAETWELILSMEYENCEGLTSDQKSRALEFLKLSSDSGYPIAMLEYSAYVTDISEGMALDKARWNAGDAQGLNDLARRLESTYHSGETPSNKVPAYAALLAFTIIAERQFSLDGIHQDPRYKYIQERKSRIEADLLPNEFDMAVDEAVKMVRKNQYCCFGF